MRDRVRVRDNERGQPDAEWHDEDEKMIKTRELKLEGEDMIGWGGRKRVRGRYVHQGQVCEVLMEYLREFQANAELGIPSDAELGIPSKPLKDLLAYMLGQVEAKYCNIPKQVVMDVFRALDVCYHLADIPLPAGRFPFNEQSTRFPHSEKWLEKLREPGALSDARLTPEAEERLKRLGV